MSRAFLRSTAAIDALGQEDDGAARAAEIASKPPGPDGSVPGGRFAFVIANDGREDVAQHKSHASHSSHHSHHSHYSSR